MIDRYMNGGCAVLAAELHALTGWPLAGVADEEEERADPAHADFPYFDHVFVIHPSGQALDVRGLHHAPEHTELFTLEHLEALFEAECFRGSPGDPDYGDVAKVAHEVLKSVTHG